MGGGFKTRGKREVGQRVFIGVQYQVSWMSLKNRNAKRLGDTLLVSYIQIKGEIEKCLESQDHHVNQDKPTGKECKK